VTVAPRRPDGPLQADDYVIDLPAGPRGERRWTVDLRRPLRADVRVDVTDGRTAGGWDISPAPLLDDVLAPMDALAADPARLKTVLKAVADVRIAHANARVRDRLAATVEARRSLAAILEGAGFPPAVMRNLRSTLQAMLVPSCWATTPLARRLLPLRQIEAVVGEIRGLEAPFGNLSPGLGYSFTGQRDDDWQVVGELDVTKRIVDPDTPEAYKTQWFWMATDKFLAPFRGLGPEAMTLAMGRLAFIGPGEAGVAPEDIVPRATFTVDVRLAETPARVRLDVEARHFDLERLVTARVNDGPPMPAVNTMYHDTRQIGRFHYHQFWWHFELPPSSVRSGSNEVELTVDCLPHQNPRLPLRLRCVGFSVHG